MTSNQLRRLSLTIHNWVGLIIAVQFLLWCVGGIVMSVIPLELVRGEVNTAPQQPATLSARELSLLLNRISSADITRATVKNIAGRKAVVAEFHDGSKRLYDAATGTLMTPIDEALARQVALADYSRLNIPSGQQLSITNAALLNEEPGDFRRKLPVWQITLDDPDGTRIYVSPQTGEVLARRNDYWRFYDFFWMLHIMDYDTRDDFNNPLIITASITSTLFVISGFILLYFRFKPGRRRKKKQ